MLDGQGFDFPAAPQYTVGESPISVTAADFDNDDHVDLVTASFNDNTVSVLRNLGDGTFATEVHYSVGGTPTSVTAVDVDGDDFVDLVTANLFGNNVSVLLNQGDGTFAAQVTYAVGETPRSVAAADIDGDGQVDLVTANSAFSGSVSVLLNQGDGTFAVQRTYIVGNSPQSVAAADIDGDNSVDLVTANAGNGTVSVLRNLGDGVFAPHLTYAVGTSPGSVAAADIDGDNFVDLVTANVGNGTVSVLRNLGDGTFASQMTYGVGSDPHSVTAADFDGDGDVDLVASSFRGTVSMLRNLDDGTFAPEVPYAVGNNPYSVAAADFDGDSHLDVVTANLNSHSVSLLRNLGDGKFAAQMTYVVGVNPGSIAAADVDGDDFVDLVTANSGIDTVSVLRNLGDGTFAPQTTYVVEGGPRSVFVVDIDGDDFVDLITANSATDTVSVLRNRGNGAFETQVSYHVGSRPQSVAAADIDGDSFVDLVTANLGNGTVSVLRNLGDGFFASQLTYAVGNNPYFVTAADFDGDEHVDLVTANSASNTISVLQNLGNGTFATQVTYVVGRSPLSVAAADIDGDSQVDLVTANSAFSGSVSVLLNQGDGTFAPQMDFAVGSGPRSVTAADIDGDGKVDLVTAHLNNSTVSVLRNLGGGTFAPHVAYALGRLPLSVATADFDGDGHVDLATANSGINTVSVLRNLGPQGQDGSLVDLVVASVSVQPNSVELGETLRVEYEVRNVGGETTQNGWVDSIYLSRDTSFDPSDLLLVRILSPGNLEPDESRTRTIETPVPFFDGFVPGEWHILVRTDVGHDVPEKDNANNAGVSDTFSIEQQVTMLALGERFVGNVAAGQSQYFRVNYVQGEPLAFRLDGLPADGAVELFIKRDGLPSRAVFDRASRSPFASEQYIYLPAQIESGTFYILVHAQTLASSPANFELTAFVPDFGVLTRSFGTGGNEGDFTLRAIGANFDPTVTARLIDGHGFELSAKSQHLANATEFYATFDLRGFAPGKYDVVFTNEAEVEVTLPQSLTIVATADLSAVIPRVIVPSAIRRGSPYSFIVEWENTSLNDAYAPLMTVGNSVAFGLSSTDRDSLGTRYTFLGTSTQGPAGILRPGQRERITFWSYSDTEPGDYTVFADRVVKDLSATFDWESVKSDLRPIDATEEEWNILFEEIATRVGPTWRDVIPVIQRNADTIGKRNDRDLSLVALLKPEVKRAAAAQGNSIAGKIQLAPTFIASERWRVIATEIATNEQFVTDSFPDGSFVLANLTPGTYRLFLQSSLSIQPFPTEYLVAPDSSIDGIVLVASPADISLKVVLPDGKPAVDSDVYLYANSAIVAHAKVLEDASASFLGVWPGTYQIVVEATGYARHLSEITVDAEGKQSYQAIALASGASLRGSITQPDGIEAAIFAVQRQAIGAIPIPGLVTGHDFEFPALAAGDYDLVVFATERSPIVVENVRIPEAGVVELPSISLDAGIAESASRSHPRTRTESAFDAISGDIASWVLEIEERLGNLFYSAAFRHLAPGVDTLWNKFNAAGGLPLFLFWYQQRAQTMMMVSVASAGDPMSLAIYGSYFDALGPVAEAALSLNRGMQIDLKLLAESGWKDALEEARRVIHNSEPWTNILDCDATLPPEEYTIEQLIALGADVSKFVSVGPKGYYAGKFRGNPVKWRAHGPIGVLVGGTGSWGNEGSSQLETADFRRLEGTVTAELGADSKIKVSANWSFTLSDAVDFEPGDIYVFDIPILVGLRVLEKNGMTWDVPFNFTTKIQIDPLEFGIRRSGDCDPCNGPNPPDSCEGIGRPASWDPNDIIGPAGEGPENHIAAESVMPYVIRFENDAERATAPAAMAMITQTLDADLDWTTFRLGEIGFGDVVIDVPDDAAFFETRYDATETLGVVVDIVAGINAATGEVRWEFAAIDPETGDLPEDPLIGFLPPNIVGPEGEGFVTYTVRPKSTVVTGDRIDAEASIVFDVNEAINTPAIFNTFDLASPMSNVLPLPATQTTSSFTVHWSGEDDAGGSGVESYDVYVSIDGQEYVEWQTNATDRSATYVGELGHSYRFYSVATDLVGHREGAPLSPDTATTVVAAVAPTAIIVQGGLTQRSYLDRVEINFSGETNLANLIANGSIVDAVTLTNFGVDAPVDADQVLPLTASQFQYEFDANDDRSRLTWSLESFDSSITSLENGFFELAFDANQILDTYGNPIDGDGNGLGGNNLVLRFHRLQGDADGDASVGGTDMEIVNAALGSTPASATWNSNADLDRDGRITVRDRTIVARANGNQLVEPPADIPTPAMTLQGDFNTDGVVDGADYTVWRNNYGKASLAGEAVAVELECGCGVTYVDGTAHLTAPVPISGDADGDLDVDGNDYLIWRTNFGHSLTDETKYDNRRAAMLGVAGFANATTVVSIAATQAISTEPFEFADEPDYFDKLSPTAPRFADAAREVAFGALAGATDHGNRRLAAHKYPRPAASPPFRSPDDNVGSRTFRLNEMRHHMFDDESCDLPSSLCRNKDDRREFERGHDEALALASSVDMASTRLQSIQRRPGTIGANQN